MLRRLLFLLLLLVSTPGAAAELEPVRVTVVRSGDGFLADFEFPRKAPLWAFFRSAVAAADREPWRLKSWTVLTPGVWLERRGRHDAFVARSGHPVPRKVRVRVTPYTEEVVADYVPALRLGGDSIALFDGHFATFSLDAADKVDELPQNPDQALIGDGGTRLLFAGRDLRIAGDVAGYRTGNSSGAYGLYGVPNAIVRDDVATVIDSELPPWLAQDLARISPQVIRQLTARLGPSGITEPTILAAWEGAGRKGASMNGGTLEGLILMRFEGQGVLQSNPKITEMARWFIAHEAAHFWVGQAVRYHHPREGWITEGGADLLAYRTVAAMDPAFDIRAALQKALDMCVGWSAKGGIADAGERGEHDAYYHCGTVLALVAERASGGDFGGFIRGLIETNQADREVSRADWTAAVEARAPGRGLPRAIAELLDKAGTARQWAGLLAKAGVPHAVTAEGKVLLR